MPGEESGGADSDRVRWRDFQPAEAPEMGTDAPGRPTADDEDEEEADSSTLAPDTNGLYFNEEGGRSTGPATTITRQDKGLSSSVGFENRDGKGRQLSPSQRARANQLRRWQRRTQVYGARERSTRMGLDEVQRMSAALGLDTASQQIGAQLFRQATERGLLVGRCIEGMAAASLCAASRTRGYPRSFDEIAHVSRVEKRRIITAYEALRDDLDLTIGPVDPCSYLPRVATKCDASQAVRQRAREIIETAKEKDGDEASIIGGAKPASIVAGALFVASDIEGGDLTQPTIAEAANVHVTTIRNNHPQLAAAYESELDNQ